MKTLSNTLSKVSVVIVMFSLFGACIDSAFAARTAKVDADGADMVSAPQKGANLVAHLKRGQHLTASNYPTEGYYKVRLPDGTLGWVKADTLDLGPMPNLSHSSD